MAVLARCGDLDGRVELRAVRKGAGEAEELLAARRRLAELEGKIGRQQLDVKARRTMTPGSAKINWRNLLHFLIPARGHDRRRLRPHLNHVLH